MNRCFLSSIAMMAQYKSKGASKLLLLCLLYLFFQSLDGIIVKSKLTICKMANASCSLLIPRKYVMENEF